MSMTGNLGYPSAFAIGLTFWAWALTGARARDPRRVRYVGPSGLRGLPGYAGLGLLYGLILLVHPITAVAAALGAVALVAGWQRGWRGAVAGRWALTGGVAVASAAVWPYFDVFALAGDDSVDGMHRILYLDLPGEFWLALLGLPALWLRGRRSARDPLVLMFALDCAVVAYGWFSGHYTYGRILGLTLVPLQFALAVELAAPPAVGEVAQGTGVGRHGGGPAGVPHGPRRGGGAAPARPGRLRAAAELADVRVGGPAIAPGEVVITDGYYAGHAIAGYGPNLAAPAWPDPSLDERERGRRVADVEAYLCARLDPRRARHRRPPLPRPLAAADPLAAGARRRWWWRGASGPGRCWRGSGERRLGRDYSMTRSTGMLPGRVG